MRDVVKFNGKPEQVTLKYASGRECSNGSYMYTLADDRVMFCTPALNEIIRGYHPTAGERLQIQLMSGNRWEVKRVDPPAGETGTTLAGTPVQPQAGVQTTQRQDTMTRLGNVLAHGNPEGPAPQPKPAPASLMTGQSQFILQQIIAAIEAAYAAEKYAAAMGRPVTFSEESIRCFAISAFISQDRGGR